MPKGTGRWSFFGNVIEIGSSAPVLREYQTTSDYFGEDNHPFHMEYQKIDGGILNGRQPDSTVWTNYICDYVSQQSNFGHNHPVDSPDLFAASTMGAARTNPSRPSVDIPAELLQLGEVGPLLRDAPKLLRNKFRLLGLAGRSNLYVQFGLVPLMEDILKLLDLKKVIDSRVKELQRLHDPSGRGLRRTVTVYTGSTTSQWDEVYQSNLGFYHGPVRQITTEVVRVHCRWLPDIGFFPWDRDDSDLVHQARRAVIGMDPTQLDTLWEALPWSWMIDWMSTCGTYFKANRNVIPAILNAVTVMRHTKTEYTGGVSNGTDSKVSPFTVSLETKLRSIGAVFPTATLTFLSENQMGLVSSLAVRRL